MVRIMQILIDLPENEYKWIMKCHKTSYADIASKESMLYAIKDGIPLPKGHGRLIDADRIISDAIESMKYPENHVYMECVIARVKLATTIIEADKEDKED